MKTSLTVFFEDPFRVGVFERPDAGKTKTERRRISREQREAEAQRRFEMKQIKKERKEARTLTKDRYARQHILKPSLTVCLFAVILLLTAGCGTAGVFDGSRTSDAVGFQMEYAVLNREESADLDLAEGDRLQVSLAHTQGTVDVNVGMPGKETVYRGTGQQNAAFILEIAETGCYHISVTGHRAKGSVSFVRIPGGRNATGDE